MKGVFLILLFYLIGNGISELTGNYIPGSVTGMILLFIALQSGVLKSGNVHSAASFLLDNMLLFFVPVCVGIMTAYQIIGSDLMPTVAIIFISTIAVLAVTGLIQSYKRNGKKSGK